MTRQQLIDYIQGKHETALHAVGVPITDTPETLFYVLNDALAGATATQQRAIADRETAQLIVDKRAALPAPQEVTDVSQQ